jgi:hypothetical protein
MCSLLHGKVLHGPKSAEYMRAGQPDYGPLDSESERLSGGVDVIQGGRILGLAVVGMKAQNSRQLHQELARYEGELHSKGFGACFRLRCEIRRVLRKLETDADLEPIRNSDRGLREK